MLAREQVLTTRLRDYVLQERARHVARGQVPTILRKHRRIPDGIVHLQPDGLPEEEAVVKLLHRQALATDRV